MAAEEAIDPQYLWILPERFELSPEVQKALSSATPLSLQHNESLLGHLQSLVDTRNFRQTAIRMFDEEELLACEKSRRTLEVILGPLPVTEHMHCREMLKVLRSIGLDIRGGLEYLIPTYRWVNCTKARSFPMSNILVTDAEKARKFINLGEHIGDDIAEHPSTLLKAAAAFALVSDLVTEKRSCEDLSIALRECQDEMAIWVGKRILFRLQTRERYRQILLDMAREEWLDEQLTGLRAKKRARVDGA